MSMVTCIELIAFLDAYVDNELDPSTRSDFDLHLLVCASCLAYLASYRETIELARGAAEREEQTRARCAGGVDRGGVED
jgi:anti-sigma factor RsiW